MRQADADFFVSSLPSSSASFTQLEGGVLAIEQSVIVSDEVSTQRGQHTTILTLLDCHVSSSDRRLEEGAFVESVLRSFSRLSWVFNCLIIAAFARLGR